MKLESLVAHKSGTRPGSKTICRLILASFCILLITGCASPATPRGMQARSVVIRNKYPFTVSVQGIGGRETNPALTSEISGDSFAQAVCDSIVESGVFRTVVPSGNGDYLLEVSIMNVDKPTVGLDMTATMAVNWELTHVATDKVIFQKVINSTYTATVGDALVAIKRLRLAQEGAARENIEEGLKRISQLNLNGKE